MELLPLGSHVGEELLILLARRLPKLMDLRLLRVGKVEPLRHDATKSAALLPSEAAPLPSRLELGTLVRSKNTEHGLVGCLAR